MSDGLKLLGAIIDTGSIHLLRGLQEDYFLEDETPVYDFMRKHYRRYGNVPTISTVQEHCGVEFPDAEESVDYYARRVEDRYLYQYIKNDFGKLKTALRDYNMDAAREVIGSLRHNARVFNTASDVVSLGAAVKMVLTEYEDAHLNPGISGVPSGLPGLDHRTGGYQAGDLVTYVARPASGKCMAPETPVLLHSGEVVRIDSLRVGDRLMGPDSKPRTVLSTNTGREEMFEVRPVRGETWRCNASHILALVCGKNLDRHHTKGSIHYYSVVEYLTLPSRVQKALQLWRTGVDYPSKPVPIDPYFVGVWLGDGTVDRPVISTPEPEIVQYLHELADREGLTIVQYEHREGFCKQYSLTGAKGRPNYVLDYVRKYCYVGGCKRIPPVFLINSREVRLSVLAGIIDTDGYTSGTGYEVTTAYHPLSLDIAYLARSCGFGVTRSVKIVNGVEYDRLYISGKALGDIPCLVPRKKVTTPGEAEMVNSSFSLVSLGEGDYFGITLNKDHLYLLGDFTVTHNTYVILSQSRHAWSKSYSVLIVTMEMTVPQITRRLLAMQAGINPDYIRLGQLSNAAKRRIQYAADEFRSTERLHLYSGGKKKRPSDVEILIQEYRPDIVFVDGVHLMNPDDTGPVM